MSIGPFLTQPAAANQWQRDFIARVAASFAHVTGRSLYEEAPLSHDAPGISAWEGHFALLTHRGDDHAMLNYGNKVALDLWQCNWDELVAMPSANTAPADDVAERAAMMQRAARDNYVGDYRGRRISRQGRLFMIENATVWKLLEPSGDSFGVAAFIPDYRLL